MARGRGRGLRSKPVLTMVSYSLTLARNLCSLSECRVLAGGPPGPSGTTRSESGSAARPFVARLSERNILRAPRARQNVE